MNITEKEKEILEIERDSIRKLVADILELENSPKNSTKLKQLVVGIQSSINKIASYSSPDQHKLDNCAKISGALLRQLSSDPPEDVQKAMEKAIYDPPEEILERLKLKGVNTIHRV